MARTPLAWRNFINNKPRMFASVGGVAFAVVLMFIEMGFLNGLYDSQIQVVKLLDADLFLVHAHKEAIVPRLPFSERNISRARGAHPDVVSVCPLYVEEFRALWKNKKDGKDYPILVYGFRPDDPVWLIPEVRAQAKKLNGGDYALIDSAGKDFYGDRRPDVRAELSRTQLTVVGTFPLGSDFRVDGNVLVSVKTFTKVFNGSEDNVDFGLVKVKPGADINAVRRA